MHGPLNVKFVESTAAHKIELRTEYLLWRHG